MKVTNAEMKAPARREVSGCIITFLSEKNMVKGNILKMMFGEKAHYFEVHEISIAENNNLKIQAHEVGYWATKFDRKADFDLRSVIGLDVELIEDAKTLANVHEMSCWC